MHAQQSCTTCLGSKSQCHQPYSSPKQLTIPEQPWNSIPMDFIEQLPASSGYTAILVVVCCLTKQSIFILTYDTVTSSTYPNYSFYMCSWSMVSSPMWHPTEAWNSFCTFSDPLAKLLTWICISLQIIILTQDDNGNELIGLLCLMSSNVTYILSVCHPAGGSSLCGCASGSCVS